MANLNEAEKNKGLTDWEKDFLKSMKNKLQNKSLGTLSCRI